MTRPGSPGPEDAPSVQQLDEILEVLFWIEGEGFDEEATPSRLSRFLTYPEPVIASLLDRLVSRGDVERIEGEPPRFKLTPVGKKEGGRRFQETFSSLLGQGHGECNDPECDCMTEGPAACRHYEHVHGG